MFFVFEKQGKRRGERGNRMARRKRISRRAGENGVLRFGDTRTNAREQVFQAYRADNIRCGKSGKH